MDWSGRVAIVTGGASGIGEATAREFAAAGARVAIFDINTQRGEQVAQDAAMTFMDVDVSDADACRAAVQQIAERFGRVDALVNSAASFIGKGLDVTTADWERSLGVNVRGCANMVQACFEPMRAAGGAAVVNIASISAHVAQPNRWTYNATKGAIVTMTKCMALDLAPHHIRVNVVSPGWIWTPEVMKAAGNDRAKWSRYGAGITCCAAWANRARWRAPCCSCAAMTPVSSLARNYRWMAAISAWAARVWATRRVSPAHNDEIGDLAFHRRDTVLNVK